MPAPAVREQLAVDRKMMGTSVRILVRVPSGEVSGARRAAQAVLDGMQRLAVGVFSRFEPASELSRLNAWAGEWCLVSEPLFQVIWAAAGAWRRTGGLFDPTQLRSLETAGYDRSYEQLEQPCSSEGGPSPTARLGGGGCRVWRLGGLGWGVDAGMPAPLEQRLKIDPVIRAVWVAPGFGLDLGGIAKGWLVDWAYRQLARRGYPTSLIDGGGDIRLGAAPNSPPWRIGLPEEPRLVAGDCGSGEASQATTPALEMRAGAIATSSVERSWFKEGHRRHHLIDPRTGLPSDSPVVQATVVASTAAGAEVLAKAAVIGGVEAAKRLLARRVHPAWIWECGR